jgi:DNA mismatch repair protein MutS2
MTFAPGDRVQVGSWGKGIIREVRNGGRYLVELKGRSMVVAGTQLAPVESARRSPRPQRPNAPLDSGTVDRTAADSQVARSLDLHGRTVHEALDALDEFLNAALMDGVGEVQVIHGRSGGRLRQAVHARLKQVSVVRRFLVDPRNAGVTIVMF